MEAIEELLRLTKVLAPGSRSSNGPIYISLFSEDSGFSR